MFVAILFLLSACTQNIEVKEYLSTPEKSANFIWQCFNEQTSDCFYDVRTENIRAACDSEDPNCKQTFTMIKNMVIVTRGQDAFNENNYLIEIESQNETSAVASVFVPKDTSWPIKITLEKEGDEWKNEQILIS